MASQSELKKRLKVLMNRPENQVCSDCPERQPRWASLIVPPPGSPPGSLPMGAFCCLECSGSHRRLGVHISFVRSVNLDSWKEKEVLAMENGGNKKVNAIFEGRLPNAAYGPSPKPTAGASGPTREKYIRDKYERRKYFDEGAYRNFLQGVGNDDDDDDDDDEEEEEEEEESRSPARNTSRAPSDAAKLRAAKLQSRKTPVLAPAKSPAKPPAAAPPPPPAPAPAPAAFDLLDFSSAPDPDVGPPMTPEPSERPPVDMFNNMAISTTAAGTEVTPGQGNGVSAAGQANSNQENFGGAPSPQPKKMTSDEIMAMFNAPAARSQLGFPSFGGAAMNGGAPPNSSGSVQTNMMMGSLGGSAGPGPQGMMGAPLSGGSVGAAAQMMPMGTGSGPAGPQGLPAGMPGGGSAGGNPMMMVGGMYQQNASQGMVGPSSMQVMMQQQQPIMNAMNAGAGGALGAGIGGHGNTQMMGGAPMMPQPGSGMGMQGAAGAGIGMNNFPMTGATNPSNSGGNMMMGGMAPMGGNMMMGGVGGTMGGGGMVMMMSPAAMNATPRGGLVNGGQQQQQQQQQVNPQTDRFASLAQF